MLTLWSYLVAWAAWTQCVDLVKEDHTRSRVASSLEDLSDSPLALSHILQTQSTSQLWGRHRRSTFIQNQQKWESRYADNMQACVAGGSGQTLRGMFLGSATTLQNNAAMHRLRPAQQHALQLSDLPCWAALVLWQRWSWGLTRWLRPARKENRSIQWGTLRKWAAWQSQVSHRPYAKLSVFVQSPQRRVTDTDSDPTSSSERDRMSWFTSY